MFFLLLYRADGVWLLNLSIDDILRVRFADFMAVQSNISTFNLKDVFQYEIYAPLPAYGSQFIETFSIG